jgi:hypothetical protein
MRHSPECGIVTERVERWTTLARDGMDIREIQEPEKHQPLCVVVQVPAVSVHEEPRRVSSLARKSTHLTHQRGMKLRILS